MPHMMASERMGYLDANALANSPARNQATITAALAALGSTVAWLVLPFSGDGVWTVTSNTSIARLYVPFGVTVDVATGVSLGVGLVDAANSAWKTGPGILNITSASTPIQLSHIACTSYFQSNSSSGPLWVLNAGAGNPSAIRMFTDQGGLGCGIEVSRNIANTNSTWEMLAVNSGDLIFARPGGNALLTLNNNGLGIGFFGAAVSWRIQLDTDSAFKPTTATWSTASDERVKTILGPYTDGMAFLRTLPIPQRFEYNGKASTPDGTQGVAFIAQALQAVAPTWVNPYYAQLEESDPTTTELLGVNLNDLFFVLTNAMKELDVRVAALESPVLRISRTPAEQEEPGTEEKTEDVPKRPRRRAS